ncbi:MAG: AEC family transporter, partial [Microbacteriaceae bacterium]
VAPVLLLQLAILTPLMVTVVATISSGKLSIKNALLQPVKNPLVIGSLLGVAVSVFKIEIPEPIFAPFQLIGASAIPLILMAFGMSLRGTRPFSSGSPVKQVALASIIKVVIMPLVAWVLGQYLFGLSGIELYAAVVAAALPTAQNMFNIAVTYNNSVLLTRDTALVTTVASFPALLVIAWLLV